MSRLLSIALGVAALAGCSAEEGPQPPTASVPVTAAPAPAPTPATAAPKPAPVASLPLNDTGIVIAGNHPRTLSADCNGTIDAADPWLMGETFTVLTLPGQDCYYGRDATVNDPADGHAGFAFAKLDQSGADLAANAEAWACVRDQVTGLVWQVLAAADEQVGNAGLGDSDDRFTWYSTDARSNAGNIGDWNRDYPDCAGYQAGEPATFCNTQALIERVNAAKLCGFTDWRLPSANELTGLLNFDRIEPAIDVAYFPATRSAPYWSADSLASNLDAARSVSFGFGGTGISLKTQQLHVRLVRGGGHVEAN